MTLLELDVPIVSNGKTLNINNNMLSYGITMPMYKLIVNSSGYWNSSIEKIPNRELIKSKLKRKAW